MKEEHRPSAAGKRDGLDMIFVAGPGHGAPGVLGPVYLVLLAPLP